MKKTDFTFSKPLSRAYCDWTHKQAAATVTDGGCALIAEHVPDDVGLNVLRCRTDILGTVMFP